MFSSTPLKIIFLSALLFASACSFFQSKPDANASPTPFVAEELKSAIPFSTKEPTIYQTEIVVTANQVEDKFFTARNGENRLTIFSYQTESEIEVLQIGENQSFTIAPNRKIYVQREAAMISAAAAEDFFTAEWLNQKTDAKFETLSPENNLARYRVNLDDAANSEVMIYFDREIGLPIKQEFYSVKDGQKILTLTMELRNFNTQTEARFFQMPTDYRKVSAKEFYETARANQIKK